MFILIGNGSGLHRWLPPGLHNMKIKYLNIDHFLISAVRPRAAHADRRGGLNESTKIKNKALTVR